MRWLLNPRLLSRHWILKCRNLVITLINLLNNKVLLQQVECKVPQLSIILEGYIKKKKKKSSSAAFCPVSSHYLKELWNKASGILHMDALRYEEYREKEACLLPWIEITQFCFRRLMMC